MWKLLLGFGSGLYIGTYYDCKPIFNSIKKYIKTHVPEKDK